MSGPPNLPPPPSGPPWGYAAAQPSPPRYTPTEPFAIVSLVAALAGWFLCFVGPIVAIVFGHIARSRIKRSGAKGSGLALAGLIIGYLEIVIGVAAIVLIIAVAVNVNDDATHSARRLATQIQVVAERTNTSPRKGDIVRRAIREAGLADDHVLVGSTHEYAVAATDNDLEFEGWRLEVRNVFAEACLYLPPTTAEFFRITNGPCSSV